MKLYILPEIVDGEITYDLCIGPDIVAPCKNAGRAVHALCAIEAALATATERPNYR